MLVPHPLLLGHLENPIVCSTLHTALQLQAALTCTNPPSCIPLCKSIQSNLGWNTDAGRSSQRSLVLYSIPLMLIANPTSVPWAGASSTRTAFLVWITACTQGWLKAGTVLLLNIPLFSNSHSQYPKQTLNHRSSDCMAGV